MNKLLRKLTISVLAVVFAVIAMGATTYAWFTVTGEVSVDPVSADVTMDSGIYISADGVTWDNKLDSTDLAIAGVVTGTGELKALTSTDGTTFNEVTQIALGSGENASKYLSTYGSDITNGTGYRIITFYVRSVNYTQLYLFKGQTSLTGTDVTWSSDKKFSNNGSDVEAGDSITTNVANAARFAINSNSLTAWDTNAKLSTYGGTIKTTIYENEAVTKGNTTGFGLNGLNNGALNYYLTKNSITPADYNATKADGSEIVVPNTIALSSVLDSVVVELSAGTTTKATDGYYYAKVVVTIWLEGWDSECYNSILSVDANKDQHLDSASWSGDPLVAHPETPSGDLIRSLSVKVAFTATKPVA